MRGAIFSAAYLRSHTEELIAAVSASGGPVFIRDGGVAKVVLQDVRSYEQMQRSLTLLRDLASRAENTDMQTTAKFSRFWTKRGTPARRSDCEVSKDFRAIAIRMTQKSASAPLPCLTNRLVCDSERRAYATWMCS
ncbi:type II toxin-antitoxin system Phd/YefM family antitoxin [Paraburkholderia azotifigens]|uniref:type II toxin-antitoxin system Phd/YefM family antitoxin n=1 Tax=Paraburkholderia azotifigens TaxID=2057004 RepID=UPI003CCC5A3B